jgi:hypothetical protein
MIRTTLCLFFIAPAFAQVSEWRRGETIDCPVTISVPGAERVRVIEFPCAKVINAALPREKMPEVTYERKANQILLRLTSEAFDTTLNVWDENNNLYTLLVRSPGDGEQPDDHLIIQKGDKAGDVGGGATNTPVAINQDTDSATTELMAQMQAGVTDPKVRWSNLTTVERGQQKPGQIEFQDDNLRVTILRVYRAPTLYGYDTLWEWGGDKPMTFNLQALWRPGILAAAPDGQPRLDKKNPTITIPARGSIVVHYVCDVEVP